jgi:hypothetical protein
MPPCRKYSSSLAVSIRTRAGKLDSLPSALVTLTSISWRGCRSATPVRVKVLAAVERGHVADELERDHAHADQVGAVDALVGLGDDGADAEQGWCPSPPSRATNRCHIPCRR